MRLGGEPALALAVEAGVVAEWVAAAAAPCWGLDPAQWPPLAVRLQGVAGGQGAGPKALPAAPSPLPQPEPLLRDSLPMVGSHHT